LQTGWQVKLNFRESAGVYQIICLPTGDTYIGSTNNFARRWHQHRDDLRLGIHANYRLTNLYLHYGAGALEFSILETCAPERRLYREKAWIEKVRPTINIQPVVLPPVQTSRRAHMAKKRLMKQHLRTRFT
jgi:group I intron endonuclease